MKRRHCRLDRRVRRSRMMCAALCLSARAPAVTGLKQVHNAWCSWNPVKVSFLGSKDVPLPSRCLQSASPRRRSTPELACSLDHLRALQKQLGGKVGDCSYEDGIICSNVLLSGSDDQRSANDRGDAAEQALVNSALLIDQSHWGVLRVKGEDRNRFLHSQGTNAFERVSAGEVVTTCFTSNIGRVVDLCEAIVLEEDVWLLSSPHRWQRLLETMNKFIFPLDRSTVDTLSDELAIFSLAGPKARDVLAEAKCTTHPRPGRSVQFDFDGHEVVVISPSRSMFHGAPTARGGSPGIPDDQQRSNDDTSYVLLVPAAVAGDVWSLLRASPAVVIAGEEEWDNLRIRRGFPVPGRELTKDYNPLEAGLWHAVHFDKGCYIGQESISRVNAYNAVKTSLYGVLFDEEGVPEGAELVAEESGKRLGVVTSMMKGEKSSAAFGLAYVKTSGGGVGSKVLTKEGVHGTVVDVPYPTRSDAESAMPPVKKRDRDEESRDPTGLEEEKAAEAARKAAKLDAMQKKLDALKARRKSA